MFGNGGSESEGSGGEQRGQKAECQAGTTERIAIDQWAGRWTHPAAVSRMRPISGARRGLATTPWIFDRLVFRGGSAAAGQFLPQRSGDRRGGEIRLPGGSLSSDTRYALKRG